MPIVALPQTTVRVIGSTSVISDPCSVVKELLDNALDASASSVQIEISQNTVDLIQLKDNGHGIPPEDHPNVCKHAFTSKIETVDDLRNVGGASLGFRGEALASVAEMSGSVTITTRVASDVTATCLKYGRDGQLISSSRTSHPAGTTVRITDFLKHIPVRRQTTLKEASKILTKLKKLLQAYGFAQPSKRLSLKVIKAKNESNNWLYAPSAEATLTDAVLKIAGRDVASSCVPEVVSSDTPGSEGSEQNRYELVALLPKLDSDVTKFSNMGQYLSVDGRPLSTHTGVGQDITKLFKTYVRAAASKVETSTKVTDPFCCLQLKCPKAVYDVNIEPGKDDVLFGDRDLVISLVEKLLTEHYGASADGQKSSPTKAKTFSHNNPAGGSGFQLLLARRRPEEPLLQAQNGKHGSPNTALSSPVSQRAATSLAPQSPKSPHGTATGNNADTDNAASESRESCHLNPWSISRINASFHTPERLRATLSSSHSHKGASPNLIRRQNCQRRFARQSSQESPGLPSPPTSSVPKSPMNVRQASRRAPSESHNSINSRRAARERDRALYGNGALDTWFQRITGSGPSQSSLASAPTQDENTPSLSQLAQERFRDQSISRVTDASTELEVPETPTHSYSSGGGDVQRSPQYGPDTASGYTESPEGSMDSGRGFPVLERWAASLHKDFDSASQTDLERALDFERRKKEANQRHRAHTGARDGQLNPTANLPPTPHHNRYLAAKASLTAENSRNETSPGPALSLRDPRAYLMRHQNDQQSHKSSSLNTVGNVQRLHISKLPFERIPDGHDLHDSCLPLPADLSLISRTFQLTTLHDSFTGCGAETDAFASSDMDSTVSFWAQRVAAMIKKHYKTKDQSQSPEWQVDLAPVVARHTAQSNAAQPK